MKYYSRIVTVREKINRFGKLGYVPYLEYVKTNEVEKFNKRKRIKFEEDDNVRKELRKLNKDCVYRKEVVSNA